MDAEKLRSTYNQYFSADQNRWSSTDKAKTIRVCKKTFSWLKKSGFKKSTPKVLDVGCAMGFYTESFRLLGSRSTGLDYSEVAIAQAKKRFPECKFVQMNGFDPKFDENFDLIFCRGFSGVNTHDLEFISGWVNKYMTFLNPGGFFVLSYSSDFSGTEKEGETVNHSKNELGSLIKMINGDYKNTFIFYYFGLPSKIKRSIEKLIGRKKKDYYSILIAKK
jgi:SAM-dependent methyltransferase